MAIETVNVGGLSMKCLVFGSGSDALVILPGLSVGSVLAAADAVEQAYRLLAERYTVYVVEYRQDVPQGYSVADAARDTAAALHALGLERADFFGASYGGMVAMEIAIAEPDLVRKLVLASTSARVECGQFDVVDEWIRLAEAGDAAQVYLAFGEVIYPSEVFESVRGLLLDESRSVTGEDLARFAIRARGMEGFDVTRRLEGIRCPALVVGDRCDRVFGSGTTRDIVQALRQGPEADVRMHMYDGYGHALYDVAPDFKERMLRFLQGHA